MPYTLRQNPALASNYWVGRAGLAIDSIVVHHAATTSFEGIGATFQKQGRQASAHYGVGRNDNVDQYVQESNAAWHCGNANRNRRSVGIENVNASGAPNWDIDPKTFNTLVELIRDIATRNNLLPLEVGRNLFGHKDIKPTACPGQLYARLHEIANAVNGGTPTPPPKPQPVPPRKSNEVIAAEVKAGAWGNNPERRERIEAAGYDYKAIQAIVNGGASKPATPSRATASQVAEQVIAGAWGNGPDRKKRIEAAGYNFAEVQALVNMKLGAGPTAPARKTNEQIANEVIVGKWGNGPDRAKRLQSAGYNVGAVQAIVNRKLGF